MFVGHLAVALAAKKVSPDVSLGTLMAAAFGLDLLWPVLLLAGVERVQIVPGATAFAPFWFESYPWSHSLLLALVWGALAGLAVAGRRRAAWVIGGVVISHWVLDFVTHRPDLPLWPGGPLVGLGLWNSVAGTLLVEGALLAWGTVVYLRVTQTIGRAGVWSLAALLALCVFIWVSGPFSPPPPDVLSVAVVGIALWLLPLWGQWTDGKRRLRRTVSG